MTTTPTLPQMLNRSNSGHRRVLLSVVSGESLDAQTASQIRGYRTCISTLYRWGRLDASGITDRGREFLEALEAAR